MSTYGYIRVSTAEQADGTSLDEQRRQIAGNAMAHGLDVTQWVEDAGVSGSLPFVDRLAAHGVEPVRGDTIIVAKLDRFSRDLRDALNTVHGFKQAGVRLIVNGHGDVTDDSNIYARLMLEILCAFAGHERRVIKDRQKTGQRNKRAQGGHIGGSAPFGYRTIGHGRSATLEAIPEQQAAIATMLALRGTGASLRAISAAVEAQHGLKASHEAVRRVLREAGAL